MKHVDLAKLPDFLKAQRWFGGKAWPIKHIEVVDHAELPRAHHADALAALLAVIEVRYELGSPERYLLAVRPLPDGTVAEALHDDACARAILQLIREGRQLPSGSGTLIGERLPDAGALLDALAPSPAVRRLGVEQSNTSIVFDEKVILKVIRRLETGVNPEYEMGQYLLARGYAATPPLLGALHLQGQAGTTLAVLHRFVPDARDGWSYLLDRLRASPTPAPGLIEELRALGRVVGELHRTLGAETGEPAFAPEPVQLEDLQRWSSSIIGELGVTLAEASSRFPRAMDRRDAVVERIQRLNQVPPSGRKIRIHGDLHLGQVLRSGEAWLVFDFEGEPARKLTQRREKQSPLKDVAGMLRSFAYAAATLEQEGRPRTDLEARTRAAFLDGYRQVIQGLGLVPEDPQHFSGLLDAFEMEKLLYEVRYELNNRPDWARIPMEALMREEEHR